MRAGDGDGATADPIAAALGNSDVKGQGPFANEAAPRPIVMQLPGPSTQMSDGTYSPESTNDVTIGSWSIWRTTWL
ncbi:MAG: hypothetical protein QOI66_5480, partial [Myxococcales bacterium]|nr:hypothetical protein [Myxococcales bacterium]